MKPLQIFLARAWLIVAVCGCTALPSQHLQAQGMVETMVEQILKLEATLAELKQGYAIVQQGLSTIQDIKKGDFDLHSLFFSSLMQVNPAIKHYGKVADILAMEIQILQGCSSTLQQFIASGTFGASDLQYLSAVYRNLKTLTLQDIDELTAVVSDGNWQMSDDQRIARIDRLYVLVQEKYSFLKSISDRARQEALLRKHQVLNLQQIGKLYQP
jgi:hypothetical protein